MLAVLLLITFGTEATKLLAVAVQGEIPPSVIFQVLLYKIPPALEIILPLVALLSVMLAIGRLYQDQEMVVLSSCGIPPRYFQWRVFWFLLPLVLVTAWVSLYLTPLSFKLEREVIIQAQVTSPLAAITPGRFNELPGGGVFYAKSISQDKVLEEVWVKFNREGKNLIMTAPIGKFEWIEGKLAMVLIDGISYEGVGFVKQGLEDQVTIRKFERFEGFLPEIQLSPPSKQRHEITTLELWNSEEVKQAAMLQWRIVTPLSILVLGLLGLKMSRSGPREGRFAKVFIALVLYVVFNQLLVTSREAVSSGELSANIGLWPVLILFLMYALYQGSLKPSFIVKPKLNKILQRVKK